MKKLLLALLVLLLVAGGAAGLLANRTIDGHQLCLWQTRIKHRGRGKAVLQLFDDRRGRSIGRRIKSAFTKSVEKVRDQPVGSLDHRLRQGQPE